MITDIIIGLVFLLFIALGFFRGFVKSAVMLVKIPVTIVVAILLASPLAALLGAVGLPGALVKWFGIPASISGFVVVIGIAIIIFIVIRIILWRFVKMSDKAEDKSKLFKRTNRLLGLLFGVLRFCVIFIIASTILYIITALSNIWFLSFLSKIEEFIFEGSVVAKWLYEFVVNIILAQAFAPKSS